MDERIPQNVKNLLWNKGIVVAMPKEACLYIEMLSSKKRKYLEEELGFDFSNPSEDVHGLVWVPYNLEKAVRYANEHPLECRPHVPP